MTGLKQTLYGCGMSAWQNAKNMAPVLNNGSHIVGRLANAMFPPDPGETVAAVPWNGDQFIIPPNSPSSRTYMSQRYELPVVQKMTQVIHKNGICIDVGAHCGYFTMLMALQAPQGAVYAFEPNPVSFRYLNLNLNRHGASGGATLHMFPYGISNRKGVAYLEDVDRVEHGQLKASGAYSVEVRSLDDYAPIVGTTGRPLSLIKVDTEGHEVSVLKGACQLLMQHPEASLIIEHQSLADGDAFEELSRVLRAYGYTEYEIIERGTWHPLDQPFPHQQNNIVYNLYLTKKSLRFQGRE